MMKRVSVLLPIFLLLLSCKEATKKKEEVKIISQVKVKDVPVEIDTLSNTSNMVYFEGGTINIGSSNGGANEKPVLEKKIESFYLDKDLVSVADFRKFVLETNYITEADKFGDSGVFLFDQAQWTLLKGANWEYPLGKDNPKSIDNHPVTHVSWNDAKVYAKWVNKRLPTEYEWEFAAKNGGSSKYAWGETVLIDGKYNANVWQGTSLEEGKVLDGYKLTSPIGTYGKTKSGLTDMGGNVWQWCEDIYASYPGNTNPEKRDPNVRSTRGGSFMFDQALENSFTTTFRAKNSVDTSLFNTGFRCAK